MLNNDSGLVFTSSGKEILADRPEPIISDIDVVLYKCNFERKNQL